MPQEEGGILTLAVTPFVAAYENWLRFDGLEPVEKALRRASNGLAFVGLGCGLCYSFDGNSDVAVFYVPLLLIGAIRWWMGWRVLRQLPMGVNGIGLNRGFLRCMIGALVLLLRAKAVLLLDAQGSTFLPYWLAVVWMTGAGWFYFFGGAARIYFTRAQTPARPKPPKVHPAPRGSARNATQREARAVLIEEGQHTPFDDMKF
jgi:hypothetical protein